MAGTKQKRGYAKDVVGRLIETLKHVPPTGKVTAKDVWQAMASHRFDADIRTILRDLKRLEALGYLKCDDRSPPHGWGWKNSDAKRMLGLSVNTALALKLAYDYVQPLMPASLTQELKALADTAERALAANAGRNLLARWPDKVRVLRSGPPRARPCLAPGVHEAICNALLNNSQIKITYRATAREHAMTYAVSPLGMVIKGGISYLIAAHADKPDPLKLSMHRIQVADLLYDEATAPASWVGLDAYIKAGYLLFPPGDVNKDQEVTLRFDLVFARNIEEMPIGDGQTVKKETARAKGEASYCLVKARVTISEEFVRWILQYGSHVEVVSPASLRKRVQGIILELQSKYKI